MMGDVAGDGGEHDETEKRKQRDFKKKKAKFGCVGEGIGGKDEMEHGGKKVNESERYWPNENKVFRRQ